MTEGKISDKVWFKSRIGSKTFTFTESVDIEMEKRIISISKYVLVIESVVKRVMCNLTTFGLTDT